MTKHDPFAVTTEDTQSMEGQTKTTNSGIICPQQNKQIGGTCAVCEYIFNQIYPVWNGKENRTQPARVWASKKRAGAAYFSNVVFEDDRNAAFTLELGKLAGDQILSGMKNKGWTDIFNPNKNTGRLVNITKLKNDSGENTYTAGVELQQTDWEVPTEVWQNAPDLDKDVLTMLEEGKFDDTNFRRIAKIMKVGDTIKFRLLPNPRVLDGCRMHLKAVYRHWGVSIDQIEGKAPINWQTTEEAPTKEKESFTAKTSKAAVKTKECFGNPDMYEFKDVDDCEPCPDFEACGKKVAGN